MRPIGHGTPEGGLRGNVAAVVHSPQFPGVIGALLLIAAAVAGWQASDGLIRGREARPFDLSQRRPPTSTHVVITGVVQTGYIVDAIGNGTETVRYVPLTASDWRPGEPLKYFLKTRAATYSPPGKGRPLPFSRQAFPFEIDTGPGRLIAADLPEPIAEAYRRYNIPILAPVMVFEADSEAPSSATGLVAAALCAVLGLACLALAVRGRLRG
jgi:hypothetical protein